MYTGPFQAEHCATTLFCGHAGKTLRFCYDRLSSLLKTLEITDMDDFTPLHMARTRALDLTLTRAPRHLALHCKPCSSALVCKDCSCLMRSCPAVAYERAA